MSISAEKIRKSSFFRIYLPITEGCILFAIIYNSLGHGVTSAYMNCCFVFPLAAGIISLIIERLRLYDRIGFNALNASVATLSTVFALKGVLIIAGTDSAWINVYRVLGTAALAVSVIRYARAYVLLKKKGTSL